MISKLGRTLYLLWVLPALLLAGLNFSSMYASHAVQSSESFILEGVGYVTFETLGWTDDVLITADSGSPKVSFRLPEGAAQGDPLWYGVELSYEWSGNPGQLGDYAFLYGRWNDRAFYQLKVKRVSELDSGFHWSMVDLVNGASQGYETGEWFAAKSTNFVQIASVQPGLNEISFSLGLLDAGNQNIQVLVKKESRVVVTPLQPARLDAQAQAAVEGDMVRLAVNGRNLGWSAHNLEVRARVFHEDSERQVHRWQLGRLDDLAEFNFEKAFRLDESVSENPVQVVMAELDWGTGQDILQAWPPPASPPFYSHPIFRSGIGAMITVVILWVGIPALLRAVRKAD